MKTIELKNENDQVIQVDPETVSSVWSTSSPRFSELRIETLGIIVSGEPEIVAKVISDIRGFVCPFMGAPDAEPPMGAGGLPTGDAPPHDDESAPPAPVDVPPVDVPPVDVPPPAAPVNPPFAESPEHQWPEGPKPE